MKPFAHFRLMQMALARGPVHVAPQWIALCPATRPGAGFPPRARQAPQPAEGDREGEGALKLRRP